MKKVKIDPGVCGNITVVEATSPDGMSVDLLVTSDCGAVTKMFETLGTSFDPYDLCFKKPGEGKLYEYAKENFPSHACCPTISGIIKAMEAECSLALPKTISITFE